MLWALIILLSPARSLEEENGRCGFTCLSGSRDKIFFWAGIIFMHASKMDDMGKYTCFVLAASFHLGLCML